MKKLTLSVTLILATITCFAQESGEDKTVKQFYTEMGGPGIMFSANFDTRFIRSRQTGLGIRFGVGFTVKDNGIYRPKWQYSIPVSQHRHHSCWDQLFAWKGNITTYIRSGGRHYYIDIQSRDAKL